MSIDMEIEIDKEIYRMRTEISSLRSRARAIGRTEAVGQVDALFEDIRREQEHDVYRLTHQAISEIQEVIRRESHPRVGSFRTIEASNRFFQRLIDGAKREAFAKINSMAKPHVIYRVNRYYFYP